MKWTSPAPRNVQISTLWQLLSPWSPVFSYFWFQFFHLSHSKDAANSLQPLPPYFQNPPTVLQPFYQDFLFNIYILDITFTFLSSFVIIDIVFVGQYEGMEVKLQNLDDTPWASEMDQNVLGSFSSRTLFLLDIVQISAKAPSFH